MSSKKAKKAKDVRNPNLEESLDCVAMHFLYWIESEGLTVEEAQAALQNYINNVIRNHLLDRADKMAEEFNDKFSYWLKEI